MRVGQTDGRGWDGPGIRPSARRAERSLSFLAETAEELVGCRDFEETLATVARLPLAYGLADWCFLYLLAAPERRRLEIGCADPALARTARELMDRISFEENAFSIVNRVMRTCRCEVVREVGERRLRAVASGQEQLAFLRKLDIRSYVCAPVRHGARSIGALIMVRAGDGVEPYDGLDSQLATAYTATSAPHLRASLINSGAGSEAEDGSRERPPGLSVPGLSRRRLEVLQLYADGSKCSEVARDLHISADTVRDHLKAVRRAFAVSTTREAIEAARQLGYIS